MKTGHAAIIVLALAGLVGCSKSSAPAAGPQATVQLQDGSSFSGTVTSNSPSAITVLSASGESRTYPMTQVSAVQYADQAATPPGTPPAAPAPSAPPAPQVIVRTIPAGTNLQVRNNETISSQTAQEGQTFSGVVAADVVDTEGRIAIPRGSTATL